MIDTQEDKIRKAIKRHDTGRRDWDCIDACLTGKDSDLEPWGQQGIEIVDVDQHLVNCVVHIGKTVLGDNVSLDVPPAIATSDAEYCKLRDVCVFMRNTKLQQHRFEFVL